MDQILNQLVALLIGSVPTVVIFILFVVAYYHLVHAPLQSTLAERKSRTSGAVEKAREAIASAETWTTFYEERMREARVAVMKARESRLVQWQKEREAALDETRAAAQEQVADALKDIDKSADQARKQIMTMTEDLAAQVTAAVLPGASAAGGAQ